MKPLAMKLIAAEPTPNPNAVKFVLDTRLSDTPRSYFNAAAAAAAADPLATALFTIEGVASVLVLEDFVTINKDPEAPWPAIRRKVKKVLESA